MGEATMGEMMGAELLRRPALVGSLRVGTEGWEVLVGLLKVELRSLWAEDLRERGLGREPTGLRFSERESVLLRERGACCCCCDMYSDKKFRGILSGERGCWPKESLED